MRPSATLVPPPVVESQYAITPEIVPWEENAEDSLSAISRTPSWLISCTIHLIALLGLGLLSFHIQGSVRLDLELGLTEDPATDGFERVQFEAPRELTPFALNEIMTDSAPEGSAPLQSSQDAEFDAILDELIASANAMVGSPLSTSPYRGYDGLSGRSGGARASRAMHGGGNHLSEGAVELALAWLAEHQLTDGSWDFNRLPCSGRCDGYAGPDATNAATGLALMCFLGAGYTHQEGTYRETVQKGLDYLLKSGTRPTPGSLSFIDKQGRMYSHGICSIALCEAYAMTNDSALVGPAQATLDFIVQAQDQQGGGWRYTPGESGDTSVVGWQIMALQSGQMGELVVPAQTIQLATTFLDSVQEHRGASYGYASPSSELGTTAVGLLCRMFLGWEREEFALQRGVQFLSEQGPSHVDLYYNYYATQVMHQYQGAMWEKWNVELRDWLIVTQDHDGHAVGSWYIADTRWGSGRLYCTCMCCLTLEVYYRHLPLYGEISESGGLVSE